MTRRFYPKGCQAIIAYVFLALPYLVGLSFVEVGAWWAILISPFGSYCFYAMFCHRYAARLIWIKNGYIGASKSYTPIDPIQHRCKVCLSDVVIADFGFVQGDSRGNPIYHAWDIPCLNLFLSDDSMERIVLCGYSMEQIKQIEEALLEENRDILFDHKSDVFKWNK